MPSPVKTFSDDKVDAVSTSPHTPFDQPQFDADYEELSSEARRFNDQLVALTEGFLDVPEQERVARLFVIMADTDHLALAMRYAVLVQELARRQADGR